MLRTSAKKVSLSNHRTRQNQLIRTNHSRRARLVSTPVRNLSATLRRPRLCALSVKSAWPRHFSLASAPETPRATKSCIICTYAKRIRNSRRISTYIFKGLKHDWNQHLQKRPSDQDGSSRATNRSEGTLPDALFAFNEVVFTGAASFGSKGAVFPSISQLRSSQGPL